MVNSWLVKAVFNSELKGHKLQYDQGQKKLLSLHVATYKLKKA